MKIYGTAATSAGADGKYHYVYRISHRDLNRHYYGKRSSIIIPKLDIQANYLSSSSDKDFMLEQKEHPEKFSYKIVQVFASSTDALYRESDLHYKFNVSLHASFYNRHNANRSGQFDPTGMTTIVMQTGEIRSITLDEFYKNRSLYRGVRTGYTTVYLGTDSKTVKIEEAEWYLANGWKKWMLGKTAFRDESGNVVICSIAEAQHRGLKGVNIGTVPVFDKQGNKFNVSKDDPRINHELTCIVGRPGWSTFKNTDGHFIKCSKNDPRVLSGELVGSTSGNKISELTKQKIKEAAARKLPEEKVTASSLFFVRDLGGIIVFVYDTKYHTRDIVSKYGLSVESLEKYSRNRQPTFSDIVKGIQNQKTIEKYDSKIPNWRNFIGFTVERTTFKSPKQRLAFLSTSLIYNRI